MGAKAWWGVWASIAVILGSGLTVCAEWPLCLASCESTVRIDQGVLRLSRVVDPDHPAVAAFVRETVSGENVGPYNIGQICDLFDHLLGEWRYVEDPCARRGGAIVPPWVSLLTLSGDCDDFAVVLASCILSLGGCAEIALAEAESGGHIYTLVYLGETVGAITRLRGYLRRRYRTKVDAARLCFDEAGGIWLPLDWYTGVPGGETWVETVAVIACGRTDLCNEADRVAPAVPDSSQE